MNFVSLVLDNPIECSNFVCSIINSIESKLHANQALNPIQSSRRLGSLIFPSTLQTLSCIECGREKTTKHQKKQEAM